jgi:hypothetical protein
MNVKNYKFIVYTYDTDGESDEYQFDTKDGAQMFFNGLVEDILAEDCGNSYSGGVDTSMFSFQVDNYKYFVKIREEMVG